jgi:hypothetical protein
LTRITAFNPDSTQHEVMVLPLKEDPFDHRLSYLIRHHRRGWGFPGEPRQVPSTADEIVARAGRRKRSSASFHRRAERAELGYVEVYVSDCADHKVQLKQ